MTSSKFISIQHEVDQALCRRDTDKLPELARRYLKHCPNREAGEVYNTLLLCQHRVNQLVDTSNYQVFRTGPSSGGVLPDRSHSHGVLSSCLPAEAILRPSVDSLALATQTRLSLEVPPGGSGDDADLSLEATPRLSTSSPSVAAPYADAKEYIRLATARDALQPTYCPPKPILQATYLPDLAEVQAALGKVKTAAKRDEALNTQFRSLLALTHFYAGNDGKCATVLATLPEILRSTITPEYARVLTLQRYTLLGIYSETSDRTAAVTLYEKSLNFYRTIQNPAAVPELQWWYHEALYRCCLLRLSFPAKEPGIAICRAYTRQARHWPAGFQPHCRIVVLTQLVRTLSDAYRHGEYLPDHAADAATVAAPPPVHPAAAATKPAPPVVYYPTTFKLELMGLYHEYEDLLPSVYRFPQAHETHTPIIDMVDQAVADWQLMGAQSPAELRALVQLLYRMSRYTYNSLHVLRHLVNSLTAYGDYEEAELALHSYWGECKRYLEKRKVESESEGSDGPKSPSSWPVRALDVPERRSSLLHTSKDARSSIYSQRSATPPVVAGETETKARMIETLATGTYVLIRFLERYREAQDILEYALSLGAGTRADPVPPATRARLHQYLGCLYSETCLRAEDPERRAKYQDQALAAYRKAAELDPGNSEVLYHYARQHAVSRNTDEALLATKQALALRPDYLNAWNLLALLISSQKDYQRALQVCEVGCRESDWCDVDAEIQQAVLSHAGPGPVHVPALAALHPNLEDGEAYLALKITQCQVYELVHGPQSALQLHSILFALYGKIYGQEAGPNPTALVSMALTHGSGRIAGLSASPGHPSPALRAHASTGDVLSTPDLSLNRNSSRRHAQHRGARALISRSTRTVHLATAEGRHLARMARDKVRGKRRSSVSGPTTPTTANHAGKDIISPRFSSTVQDLPRINFQSTVSVNSVAHLNHGRHLSTSWLPGGGVNPGSSSTNVVPSGRPSSVGGALPSTSRGGSTTPKVAADPAAGTEGESEDGSPELYKVTLRKRRARQALADLWLLSAAAFRRLGRHKDARAAIVEAEGVYPEYPAVWCQHGLLMTACDPDEMAGATNQPPAASSPAVSPWLNELEDPTVAGLSTGNVPGASASQQPQQQQPPGNLIAAIRHFMTGLALGPLHTPTRVHLARAYLRLGKAAIATGLLQEITRGTGWDVAEAWTLLAQIMLQDDKVELANEYLVFALELENAKPVLPFQNLSW
ncbi:hypothetical protein IWQ60_000910 [Tieghemiomyces parasiticus]|uniref:Uncharacterized protein n=1 Tax=Tieghemiomyces parasiticus TaxID=78921 RepID=A0A9W8ADZ4_9FUNG|nr:hypothetical protein IWQ60_000910 [Tieghemiomyces parasiticus]